jgi:DNA-directed RNA polymerase subunit omega
MRDDYFNEALDIVGDRSILVFMLSGRVRMLRNGDRTLVESLEELSIEDIVLREIIEGRILYVLGDLIVLDDIVGMRDTGTWKRALRTRSNPSTSPLVNAHADAMAPT